MIAITLVTVIALVSMYWQPSFGGYADREPRQRENST